MHFSQDKVHDYQKNRDYPNINGTSQLSPYLAQGVISARQCITAALETCDIRDIDSMKNNEGAATWISELIWREFYNHIIHFHPDICRHKPFKLKTDNIPWRYDDKLLEAWKNGMTGFPIVDAGMRQLLQTGWMHNRLRMVTAMFFSKILLLDWRLGEKHFMEHLIDGDFAANNGGWQWCASTGTDAVPYFRLFNPITQSQRFDPTGDFIRRFFPELYHLDSKTIHNPFAFGVKPKELNYPQPIVDYKAMLQNTIDLFKKTFSMKKIGFLGYGYTASYFAQLLVREGYEVWGTSQDTTSLQYEVPPGVEIIDFNLDDISRFRLNTSFLLVSTPPTDSGFDPSLALLKALIIANKETFQWIGYLSSTGVYGDHQGEWVDESSPCYAKTARTRNRFSAEKAWFSLCGAEGLPVMIFRLSGIYGPGRNALDRLRAGKSSTVFKEGQYFSRIHFADICFALFQSISSPMPGEIINVSDDYPSGAHEVDQFAADLLQLEKPRLIPYEQASLSPMAKEFYESNRRVSNSKLKRTILPKLRYPSYKEGLNAILSGANLA